MKLNKTKISFNFWFFAFIICILLYYFFFTVNGAIRRNLLNGYLREALFSKIVKVPKDNHNFVYTTNPIIKNKENNKQIYFSCYKKK